MEIIKADIQRYFKRQSKSISPPIGKKIKIYLENYGLHAIFVYRFGYFIESKITEKKLYLIKPLLLGAYYILNFLIIKMYDIKIDRKAAIGKGLYIAHFGGIDIAKCIMGENISLHHRVRIEGDGGSCGKTCHIGNNVWIGPHAIIKKGIKISDGATIAAGAVVIADVESKCLAIGNPARILKKNYNNSELIE